MTEGDSDFDDYDEPDEEPSDPYSDEESSGFINWPRDPKLDPAKGDLEAWFTANRGSVFYGRQIEVIFEKKYFHWITHKALKELTAEGIVLSELRTTPGNNRVRLYWSKRTRYSSRAATALTKQVDEHSSPQLTRAIGHHAESLFGLAAARAGFRPVSPAVREYRGKVWKRTEHDLDWIFERDGIGWGVEIKNTWAYIDRDEMFVKIEMSEFLGVKPLFIMRWAPKSYIETIRQAGGFGLLYETQYFPLNHEQTLRKLTALQLPVASQTAVPEQVFRRFVTWHQRQRR